MSFFSKLLGPALGVVGNMILPGVGGVIGTALGSAIGGNESSSSAQQNNQAATDATTLQSQIAKDQWDRYKTIYTPIENNLVTEAKNYDSPENYARAAGDAQATVSEQFSKARDRLSRTPGLDPSTPGAQANMMGLELAQATTDATQQNAARQRVKDTAFARKTDALSLGKGLPAQASAGLASVTRNNLALGDVNQANANRQSANMGSFINTVASSKPVSDWLGSVGTKIGASFDNNQGSGFGTGKQYGMEDLGAYI
jgi:hypothetical protein